MGVIKDDCALDIDMNFRIEKDNKGKNFPHNGFIYNDMTLQYDRDNYVLICDGNRDNIISFHVDECNAYVGIWLLDKTKEYYENAFKYISKRMGIKRFFFRNSLYQLGKCSKSNHWEVVLPDSKEKLIALLKAKHRYNLRRQIGEAEKINAGGKHRFEEYKGNIPTSLVEQYFEYKNKSLGTEYHLSAEQYIEKYHVTNCYVMYLGEKIGSILFSCEQGNLVYLENLAYNEDYKKYSVGFALYVYFLETLCEKGKMKLYLGDGQQDYKKRFNAIERETFNGCYYVDKWTRSKDLVANSLIFQCLRRTVGNKR